MQQNVDVNGDDDDVKNDNDDADTWLSLCR